MRLVVELPDELHARFKARTASEGLKQARLVRSWVESWVERPESGPKPPESPLNTVELVTNAAERQRAVDELLRKSRKRS